MTDTIPTPTLTTQQAQNLLGVSRQRLHQYRTRWPDVYIDTNTWSLVVLEEIRERCRRWFDKKK